MARLTDNNRPGKVSLMNERLDERVRKHTDEANGPSASEILAAAGELYPRADASLQEALLNGLSLEDLPSSEDILNQAREQAEAQRHPAARKTPSRETQEQLEEQRKQREKQQKKQQKKKQQKKELKKQRKKAKKRQKKEAARTEEEQQLLDTGRQALEQGDLAAARRALSKIRYPGPVGKDAQSLLAICDFHRAVNAAKEDLAADPSYIRCTQVIKLLYRAEQRIGDEAEAAAIRTHELNIVRQYVNTVYQLAVNDKQWPHVVVMLDTLVRTSDREDEAAWARREMGVICANLAVEGLNEINGQRNAYFAALGLT